MIIVKDLVTFDNSPFYIILQRLPSYVYSGFFCRGMIMIIMLLSPRNPPGLLDAFSKQMIMQLFLCKPVF